MSDDVKACLLDLDGVLTQTAEVDAAAWKASPSGPSLAVILSERPPVAPAARRVAGNPKRARARQVRDSVDVERWLNEGGHFASDALLARERAS